MLPCPSYPMNSHDISITGRSGWNHDLRRLNSSSCARRLRCPTMVVQLEIVEVDWRNWMIFNDIEVSCSNAKYSATSWPFVFLCIWWSLETIWCSGLGWKWQWQARTGQGRDWARDGPEKADKRGKASSWLYNCASVIERKHVKTWYENLCLTIVCLTIVCLTIVCLTIVCLTIVCLTIV